MKTDEFTKRLKRKLDTTIDTCFFITESSNELYDFKDLKSLIPYVDFKCDINPDGGCKQYPKAVKCCCNDCLYSCGYFGAMTEPIEYYAKLFSSKTGFWRKAKGCILPHEHRSIVCLTHHCNHSYQKKSYDNRFIKAIDAYKRILRDLENKLYEMREKSSTS